MKQQIPRRTTLALALALAGIPFATSVQAQIAPDAGQTLQQLQPPIAPPRESKPVNIQVPNTSDLVLPGGVAVVVNSVSFEGNSVISQQTLQSTLGEVAGKSFDLAGLRGLADRITALYHANGFSFALALIPPQDLQQGALRIEIIEGRYGVVKAEGKDTALAMRATPFLSRLKPGAVIDSVSLERASLLLEDLPGVQTTTSMRPGIQPGTGDLIVQVKREKWVSGDIGLDNAGSRYTGQTRVRANLFINSPFMLGDQISATALVSDEQLRLGVLGYSLPLGVSGLRGNVGYAHTSYLLTKEFASLQANGTAKVSSAGLSYSLVRSQKTNLTLNATYQSKTLQDNRGATDTHERKSSESVPVTLNFDHRDSLGGGGITYGSVAWTPGKLMLDAALSAADTNRTAGQFNKFNLDMVRLQSLPAGLSLMGRLNLQTASKNLDSSEKMGLGGVGGVRAYPTGEGIGDQSALAQLELRYRLESYAPFVFWDAGTVKTNVTPQIGTTNNSRSLSGAGVGVRYQRNAWNVEATMAWRGTGGAPQAEPGNRSPRVWISAGYKF